LLSLCHPLSVAIEQDPIIAMQTKFRDLVCAAEKVIADGGGQVDCDVKTIALDLAAYKKQYTLASSMLALMERSSR
jgi:hypothetical protein